jgi:hypothetical protein
MSKKKNFETENDITSEEEIEDFIIDTNFDPDESHHRLLEILKKRFRATGNPFYVWEAIRLCSFKKFDKYLDENPLDDTAPDYGKKLFEQLLKRDTDMEFPLPGWVCAYLRNAAFRIWNLERGLDERLIPDESKFKKEVPAAAADFGDKDEFMVAFSKWRNTPTLIADGAIARIPSILGFIIQGKNFLARIWKQGSNANLYDVFCDLKDQGLSANQAYSYLAEHLEIDERTIRRRISASFKDV